MTRAIDLQLQYSVGPGGENHPMDVAKVAMRLQALGFLDGPRSQLDGTLTQRLRLFESAVQGSRRVTGRGLVSPGGALHQWLMADNAPKWELMPAGGPGFDNYEWKDQSDDHDYGTSWASEVIRAAGQHYEQSYRGRNPSAALMEINDVSRPGGGDTGDHEGHETGLDIDVRVPRRDGRSGTTISVGDYDRSAARAMIQAFRAQGALVRRVLFNDRQLIAEGLCQASSGHDNHFHVDVQPPGMQAGTVVARGPAASGNIANDNALASANLSASPFWGGSSGGSSGSGNSASAGNGLGSSGGSSLGNSGGSSVGNGSGSTPAPASTGQSSAASFGKELKQPPMQASQAELEVLARICKGEALQCSFEGKVAVCAVVLNRVRSAHWPNSITGVAQQPKQFSCYNADQRSRLYYGTVPQECWEAARAVLQGRDPSMGADHYFNPHLVKPSWARGMKFLRSIGSKVTDQHDFYQKFTDHQKDAKPAQQSQR